MLPIDNRQISYNRTPRNVLPIAIVVHDTGNSSAGADADANFRYFNTIIFFYFCLFYLDIS